MSKKSQGLSFNCYLSSPQDAERGGGVGWGGDSASIYIGFRRQFPPVALAVLELTLVDQADLELCQLWD